MNSRLDHSREIKAALLRLAIAILGLANWDSVASQPISSLTLECHYTSRELTNARTGKSGATNCLNRSDETCPTFTVQINSDKGWEIDQRQFIKKGAATPDGRGEQTITIDKESLRFSVVKLFISSTDGKPLGTESGNGTCARSPSR